MDRRRSPLRRRTGSDKPWGRSRGLRGNNLLLDDEGALAYPKEAIVASHAAFERAYRACLGAGADAMRCGHRISPCPFVVSRSALHEMVEIQAALSSGLAAAVRSWGRPGSRIRTAMPLPSRAADILLRCAEFANGLPSVEKPLGAFRPDVLIGDDGRLRVCEINARFALNGYFVTHGCATALLSMPSDSILGSLALGVVPSTQSLVGAIAERFDAKEPLYVVVGKERVNDLALLEGMLEKHKGDGFAVPEVRFVHPSQLRGGEAGSVICAMDDKHTAEATVKQCILELHQDELLALSDAVLDGLLALSAASRCLNPVWTILLCHDKRMLGILRSLTAEELPDETTRSLLRKSIVPTTHVGSIDALERLVLDQRGLVDTSLVAKPCLLGKGEGILFMKDFETPESFVDAVAKSASRMLETAEPGGEAFPYVVQSFIHQHRFDVLRPPADDPALKPVSWHVVGTILCLDEEFLGPGIFRSSETDIVALCNGGMMLAPALALPLAQPHLRFVEATLDQVRTNEVKSALINDGMALLSLGRAVSDQQQFEDFIRRDLDGMPHQHSATVGSVWTIQPTKEGGARSHTAEPFLPHTDASFEQMPPRFFALSIVRGDHRCGGMLGCAKVEDAIGRLSNEDFDTLRTTVVHWKQPTEFTKDGKEHATTAAPVLFSRRRARVRSDIMETSHLSASEELRFWAAYDRFYSHLDDMCYASARLYPEGSIILMDNQRFVHARTAIKDVRRELLRIRFDLPESPEVLNVLEAASTKSIGHRLEDWPIQTKAEFMSTIDSQLAGYCGRGNMYWSPSGGTTSSAKGAEACAIPSTNDENRTMRSGLTDLLCGVGAVPRDGSNCVVVNLFASGNLYRSQEIFADVFAAVDATHLPIGSKATDEEALLCIERFGASILCGWGSRILQLCETARSAKTTESLSSITTVIHGGEKLSASNRTLISDVCGGNVGIFGVYGNAEAGVFGVSIGNAASENEQYAVLPDCVHVEIVDDSGTALSANEWGNIVVTNLKRMSVLPLIRFDTGDIGRLLKGCPGYEQVLEIKGRSGRASAFRLSCTSAPTFMVWTDIEQQVLEPLLSMASESGATCLAQIVVSKNDKVTLVIFTLLPRKDAELAMDAVNPAFSVYLTKLGAPHIEAETRLLESMHELIRSPRSQKLMLWVDQRRK